MARMIQLQSRDQKSFAVELDLIKFSGTLDTLVKALGIDHDANYSESIPLPNVDGDILAKVIEWCRQHKDDAVESAIDFEKKVVLPDWDQQYFNVEHKVILDIIQAANYLDIKELLNFGCQAVAEKMTGATTEKIREDWKIVNDFTAEEEEELKKEHSWCRGQ